MQKQISMLCALAVVLLTACHSNKINRKKMVERHTVEILQPDSLSSLTIGNGNFAFTVDITGLQSFPAFYNGGIPLGTESNWGWHSFPNTENYNLEQVYKTHMVNGREVVYVDDYRKEESTVRAQASEWLRANPHRMNLGTLGFRFFSADGKESGIEAVENASQKLNPYTGKIESYFEVEGIPVNVETVCHSTSDLIAVKVSSPLLELNRLQVTYQFNSVDDQWKNAIQPLKNSEEVSVLKQTTSILELKRALNDFTQYTAISSPNGTIETDEQGVCKVTPKNLASKLEVAVEFSADPSENELPAFDAVLLSSETGWKEFWESGAAADFSDCIDPRASELERRVVLSQYLTRAQCAGNLPPQETGLTMNSWYGKFHMEMIWWHGVHFALWNRPEIPEKQVEYYSLILEKAKNTAAIQGYDGARWPKMTDPSGSETPSGIGPYLIWQQPHPIYLCSLLLQQSKSKNELLKKYEPIIRETANFMASYPNFNKTTGYYDLGPALIPAQERFKADSTINPSFELAYWYWGLSTAIDWLKQLHEDVPEKWTKVLNHIAPLPVQDTCYLFTQSATDSYTNPRYLTDHPMVLGMWGMLPKTNRIDSTIFENTYQSVKTLWHWEETWGWDFPLVAMAAAELGHSEDAIDFLLMNEMTNSYLKNGNNYQDERLPMYLPGNGALLTAVAQMCIKNQFPNDGKWNVKWVN